MTIDKIIKKLTDDIWELENAYEIRDIYCVIDDLKRIINDLENIK